MIKWIFVISILYVAPLKAQQVLRTPVLVVGGGTGGTAAAIASAREGIPTLLVEEGPWLGGMISAAGVSATDGNHRLPSGLWKEFRQQIYNVYGGPSAVETGWVSNTQFEPHVADSIFKAMALAEKGLTVMHGWQLSRLQMNGKIIRTVVFTDIATGKKMTVEARVVIDATELGDVIKMSGAAYDLGMEAGSLTGEKVGVAENSPAVQDLTWVAILQDFGKGADKTISKPSGYDPAEFDGSNIDYYKDSTRKKPSVNAQKMLDYGRLPRGKYMLNWPVYGNDTYLNVVEMNPAGRRKALEVAKATTLRFVYFIQHELGLKHLGLAVNEFPGTHGFALMPYHREGRRIKGLVRLTLPYIATPFEVPNPLYRTGISVGDYPVDHHHKKNPDAPQQLEFYPIPSYNIPLGALIPAGVSNLIAAEKSISVSNVVNGTTRLQPAVLLTGQAAGILAAASIQANNIPAHISVRSVQERLLSRKAWLLPYIDVNTENPFWESIQRVGATGILRGKGLPFKWANQTWFYPDSHIHTDTLHQWMNEFLPLPPVPLSGGPVTVNSLMMLVEAWIKKGYSGTFTPITTDILSASWKKWGLTRFEEERPLTRAEIAVLIDKIIDPFSVPVNHFGRPVQILNQ